MAMYMEMNDERAAEIEKEFSYDGYQIVRREMFAHQREPAMTIRYDSISFNTASIVFESPSLATNHCFVPLYLYPKYLALFYFPFQIVLIGQGHQDTYPLSCYHDRMNLPDNL